jgi:hypothetical protein
MMLEGARQQTVGALEKAYPLFLPPSSFANVHESQIRDTLHHARGRIAQEFAAGFQRAVYADAMLGGHEKVGGLGGMMRCLFCDVIASSIIGVVPVTGKDLAEDGIERFLDSSAGPGQ